MNRLLCLLIFFAGLSSTLFSQNTNLNDYSYIIVPAKFDFLLEEDQFQINSMTKFYLTKNGFNAFFNTEVPDNVRRCDGLWADVIKSSGLVYTKLEVVIKDCKGNELFRSQEGKSKFKYYQKAYQDALRKAFISFQTLNVSQPDMIEFKKGDMTDKLELKGASDEKVNDIPVKEAIIVSETISYKGNLPENPYTTYTNNGSIYLLRKMQNEYTFYQETKNGELLLKGNFSRKDRSYSYKEINGNSYDVTIDELGNISIYIDGNPVLYSQLDQ